MKKSLCATLVALVATSCVYGDICKPYDEPFFSQPTALEVADATRQATLNQGGIADTIASGAIGGAGTVADFFSKESELQKCLNDKCNKETSCEVADDDANCKTKIAGCQEKKRSEAKYGYVWDSSIEGLAIIGTNPLSLILILLIIVYLAFRKPIRLKRWKSMPGWQRRWQEGNLLLVAIGIAFVLNIPDFSNAPAWWKTWWPSGIALVAFVVFLAIKIQKRIEALAKPTVAKKPSVPKGPARTQSKPKSEVCPLCGGPDCVKYCVKGHGLLPKYRKQKTPEDEYKDEDVEI